MQLLSRLTVRRRFAAWREQGAHRDRIMAEARKAVNARYGITDARVEGVLRASPSPMRGLPRPGPAWFLRFGQTPR